LTATAIALPDNTFTEGAMGHFSGQASNALA
jgi:hypothetical protein